jgi:sugar/nucleoside kinase (ribokinase family)
LKRNIDCLFLGDAIFDLTVILQKMQTQIIQGGTINSKYMSISPGGIGNVAVLLSKLGGKAAQGGMVGNDLLGNAYSQDLKKNKVMQILFKNNFQPTGILLAYVSRNGQRSFLVSRGANSHLKRYHIDKIFRKVNPKILYISGHMLSDRLLHDTIFYAAKIARKKGIKIVFACTPYNLIKLNRFAYLKLLKLTYCLCLNLEEARALTKKKKIEIILAQLIPKIKLLALTLGKNGCVVASENQIVRVNTKKVKVVDTTGAGDAFAAAIIFGIVKKNSNKQMAKLGVRLGTLAVQQMGPRLI